MARRNRQLCVKIAYDVLAQLRAKRYEAKHRVYVQVETSDGLRLSADYDNGDGSSFQDYFKARKYLSCKVCALGSCFVSLVNLKNECSVEDMLNEYTANDMTFGRLEPLFGPENLTLMESAFEADYMENFSADVPKSTLDAAIEWASQWEDPNQRLRQIMLNVIRNNGDFKLPKKFEAKARRLEQEELAF